MSYDKDGEGWESQTVHYFVAGRERWQAEMEGDNTILLEETSKNGQEDCHVSGYAELIDGRWVLSKDIREDMRMYLYTGTADSVQAFLDKHGAPEAS